MNSKPFSGTKSIKVIVMFIFFSVFLVGSISAFEFDNVKTFNETDRSLIVHNAFNLPLIGEDIAKITPLTPHVVSTFPGRNQTVARFFIENYADDYSNVFKEMEFYNLKDNNASINRQFFFQYEVVIGTKEKPIYQINCVDEKLGNGTTIENCSRVILRYETVDVTEWKDLDVSQPLPKGNYTIKVIADVYSGDHIEFIPTWFGVRMPEYSVWTAELNDLLVFYYNFEQGAGTAIPDVTGNLPNGTSFNTEDADWQEGIIGNGLNFGGTNESANTTYRTNYSVTDNFSISFWYNSNESVQASREFFGTIAGDGSAIGVEYLAGLRANYRLKAGGDNVNVAETSNFNDGLWHMHTIVRDTSLDTYNIYFDSISEANGTDPATTNLNFNDVAFFLAGRNQAGGVVAITPGEFDEFGWWNRSLSSAEVIQLFNGGDGITFLPITPTVNITSPENISFITEQTQLNFTVDSAGIRCWFSIDGGVTNSSDNDCTQNFTGLTSVLGLNTWIVFSNSSNGDVGQDNVTFKFSKFLENTSTFEAFVFETTTQSYTINITTNGTDDPSSANLIYAGDNKGSGTITNTGGNNFNVSSTIDIPLGSGNNTWFFNVTTAEFEEPSANNQQEVSGINLTFCQASPQNVEYINFSFKNETTSEEDVNASIVSSSWQYFLGTGSINRTLSYSNSTEALNYAFCFSPSNQTVTTSVDLDYTNSISQQRKFNPSPLTLTNTTTQQTLFLLPTVDGIFVTFQVVDPAEQVISGVSSNVTKDGDIISSGITDDAGLITYFLDPDTTYVFSFSKTGLTGVTTTLVPTQTSFTIIMGTVTTINQFDTTIGIDYTITPNNLTLVNGTNVNFSLDLVSTFNILEEFGFVLRNSTGTIFNSTSSTTGTGGLLSQTLNTGNNTNLIMEVFWTITGNQTNVTRIWLVFNLENEGFSVLTFFNDLSIYLTSGLFGLDDFGLGIIVFLIILISTGIVSVKFGITSPPGISIVVFSLVAFFDVALGIMPNPINAIPNFPTIFVGLIFLGTLYSEVIR